MATISKVYVACEFQFSEPDEVRAIFHKHEAGIDKNIEYDEAHHHFIVDCSVWESRKVGAALQKIVRDYVENQEALNENIDEIADTRKVRPIVHQDAGSSAQDLIWQQVDRLEAELANNDDQAQLIPQITMHRAGKFSKNDMKAAFSSITIAGVAQASNCQVDLLVDSQTNSIRVTGSSQAEIDHAMLLLANAEEQFQRNTSGTSFDFFDDEGQVQPHMRFVCPVTAVDALLFERGAPPLCELVAVIWNPTSRQYRIHRKPLAAIDAAIIKRTLWPKPLKFQFTEESRNPAHWPKKQIGTIHGDLSLPQLGRTERWVEQIANEQFDPSETSDQLGVTAKYGRKTVRVLPNRATAAQGDAPLRAIPLQGPNLFDEKIKEDSDDSSTSAFEPLTAPNRGNSLLQSKQWSYIHIALKSAMEKALGLHRKALSFELRLGRAYVHLVSLKAYRPPGKGQPADVFGEDDWPRVFRIREAVMGASTHFSRKLTQLQEDIEFLLNLKMKGGEPLFETDPKFKRAFFEITCQDTKTSSDVVIELMDGQADITLEGVSEDAGSINFHYPSRSWDCSWQLSARSQAFTKDQQAVLAVFKQNAFVWHDSNGLSEPILYSKRHPRVSLRSIRLIRETVHRAKGGLSLVLSQVKVLEIESMGEEAFKAFAADDAHLTEAHNVWWEAKLVSDTLQRMLSENRDLELGAVAGWDVDEAEPVLRAMLEMGQHLVPKIDNVGFMSHLSRPDRSSQEKSAEQAKSQTQGREKSVEPSAGRSQKTHSQSQYQGGGKAGSQHPLIPSDR